MKSVASEDKPAGKIGVYWCYILQTSSPRSLISGQGFLAVASSITVYPNDQMSLRVPTGISFITSGAIHKILPLMSLNYTPD